MDHDRMCHTNKVCLPHKPVALCNCHWLTRQHTCAAHSARQGTHNKVAIGPQSILVTALSADISIGHEGYLCGDLRQLANYGHPNESVEGYACNDYGKLITSELSHAVVRLHARIVLHASKQYKFAFLPCPTMQPLPPAARIQHASTPKAIYASPAATAA